MRHLLVFDIESDGLLDSMTRIHCISIYDTETKEIECYRPEEVEAAVISLYAAVRQDIGICGHNIINFDIPAIQKIFPWFDIPRDKRRNVVDTLVYARLAFANVAESDYARFRRGSFPGKLIGAHTLKAYGYRLGVLKGTYAEDTEDAWACFNEEMLEYNKQDVIVTVALLNKLKEMKCSEEALKLEHRAQWLMSQQERNGFPFDIEGAKRLESVLRKRWDELSKELTAICPKIPDKVFVPKRDNKKLGYKAGVPIQRYKEFNPSSRQQIEWILRNYYKYSPSKEDLYSDDGRLKIDENTFKFISKDESAPPEVKEFAPKFDEMLMVQKRLGQLADGQQAWLKCVKADGRIHGHVNPNGAVTGRATHSQPNVTQVPHNSSPYGEECRSLFGVPNGWTQAGIDACGLELRCLAHFLFPYDNGVYAHEVVHGDIHTANQKAAGLPTRDNAKTFNEMEVYKTIENGEHLERDNTVLSQILHRRRL